jgi:hypothetical protein
MKVHPMELLARAASGRTERGIYAASARADGKSL